MRWLVAWLKAHKTLTGALIALVGAATHEFLPQYEHYAKDLLLLLGAALLGGGVLNSDKAERAKQAWKENGQVERRESP